MENLFSELTLVLLVAGGCALLVSMFKQPTVLAYILAGLLLGPFGVWKIHQGEILHSLSEIGITLLLFMVGLELDISELKKIGRKALIAGAAQVTITGAIGLILALGFGFSPITSIYIAVGLSFSSTIIVVKLLSEKRELQSLYGRLALGIFLVQDLVALVMLMILSSGGDASGQSAALWSTILLTAGKAGVLALLIALVSRVIFPRLLKFIGKSDELLLIFSLAWAIGFASFVTLPFMGFSLEIGGFLAGLALSRSSLHHEVSARIRSLRDFFVMLFFVVLGSQLQLHGMGSLIIPALLLSVFVLVGKPLIVLTILASLGYKPRTGFMTGLTVGQVSEFSLILIALAIKIGHVGDTAGSLLTLVAIITIAVSSFAIMRGESLYDRLAGLLDWFDFKDGSAERHLHTTTLKNHIVLLGAHRTGKELAESFLRQGQRFVIIDFNPEVAERYSREGIPVICGDASDPYIQELANFRGARMIVSTLPGAADNHAVIESVRNQHLHAKLIVTAQNEQDAKQMYQHDVDYVLLPHYINGLHLTRILKHPHPHQHLSRLKQQHLKALAA